MLRVRWFAIVAAVMVLGGVATADKLDDAVDKTAAAWEKYEPIRKHYEDLRRSYDATWKAVVDQQVVVRDAFAAANAAVAKFGKGSKEGNEATLKYAAEHKKLDGFNADAERADPKHDYTGPAIDRYYKLTVEPAKADAEATLDTAKKLFDAERKRAKSKAELARINHNLDQKLDDSDRRRAKQADDKRSPAADAANPGGGGGASGGSSGGVHFSSPTFDGLRNGGFHP